MYVLSYENYKPLKSQRHNQTYQSYNLYIFLLLFLQCDKQTKNCKENYKPNVKNYLEIYCPFS